MGHRSIILVKNKYKTEAKTSFALVWMQTDHMLLKNQKILLAKICHQLCNKEKIKISNVFCGLLPVNNFIFSSFQSFLLSSKRVLLINNFINFNFHSLPHGTEIVCVYVYAVDILSSVIVSKLLSVCIQSILLILPKKYDIQRTGLFYFFDMIKAIKTLQRIRASKILY